MRAVLDPNVLIAGLLSRTGAPAQLMTRWLGGEFELVVSDRLLDELERAFTYPKIALAAAARATLVTGDADLLELADSIPVLSPRAFFDGLA